MSASKCLFTSSLILLSITTSQARNGIDLKEPPVGSDSIHRAKATRHFLENYYTTLAQQFPKKNQLSKENKPLINVEQLFNVSEVTKDNAVDLMSAAIIVGGEAPLTHQFLDRYFQYSSQEQVARNQVEQDTSLSNGGLFTKMRQALGLKKGAHKSVHGEQLDHQQMVLGVPNNIDDALIKARLMIDMQRGSDKLVLAVRAKRAAGQVQNSFTYVYLDTFNRFDENGEPYKISRVRLRIIGATEDIVEGQVVRKGLTAKFFQPDPLLEPIGADTKLILDSRQKDVTETKDHQPDRAFVSRKSTDGPYKSRFQFIRDQEARINEEERFKVKRTPYPTSFQAESVFFTFLMPIAVF